MLDLVLLRSVSLDLFWETSCNEKCGVNCENGFAISDPNTNLSLKMSYFPD